MTWRKVHLTLALHYLVPVRIEPLGHWPKNLFKSTPISAFENDVNRKRFVFTPWKWSRLLGPLVFQGYCPKSAASVTARYGSSGNLSKIIRKKNCYMYMSSHSVWQEAQTWAEVHLISPHPALSISTRYRTDVGKLLHKGPCGCRVFFLTTSSTHSLPTQLI